MNKGISIGIIFLLVGMCIIPSITGDIEDKTDYLMTDIRTESESVLEEPPEIEWMRKYGWDEHSDGFESVDLATDGGYIAVGTISLEEAWLLKTDKYGFEEWSKEFGTSNIDWFRDVQVTSDGGYIISGHTSSYGRGVWLVKTDSNGNEQWNKTYGHGRGFSVQQTDDGGYIIGGDDDYYSIMIKTDSNGTELWRINFGGPSNSSIGNSVVQTFDGGFVLTGKISDEVFLLKTDGDGNELWNKTYGFYWGFSVKQTTDGGLIVCGWEGGMAFLLKTDENGTVEWYKTFVEPHWDYGGEDVQQTTDGGYIIVGVKDYNYVNSFNFASFLLKTDSNGNKEWEVTFSYKPVPFALCFSRLYSVQQTIDGGYVAAGMRSLAPSSAVLVKVSPDIQIEVTKPVNALYVFNREVLPLSIPFIIGPIDIEVDVSDVDFDVEGVEFYIDSELLYTDKSEPYSWRWRRPSIFEHSIEVDAYSNDGDRSSKVIMVRKFLY